jgi:DNA-binding NarL/FixJ family response regulator
VIIADDHGIMREGLRSLFEKLPDVEVVGDAEDGRGAVALAIELRPDLVVMDVGMPGLNGIDACRQIIDQMPTTRVLALSMHSDARFVTRMLEAGASGYLVKSSLFEQLADAVKTVAAGEVYISPQLGDAFGGDHTIAIAARPRGGKESLTRREREVLQLVAEGKSTKAIAAVLHVSTKTIDTHRAQIKEKLGMRSVAELTKYAIKEGLTGL